MSSMTPTPLRRIHLTQAEFASLGAPETVYIRPVRQPDGRTTFSVHAANGATLADDLPSFEQAVFAARSNEFRPVSLH